MEVSGSVVIVKGEDIEGCWPEVSFKIKEGTCSVHSSGFLRRGGRGRGHLKVYGGDSTALPPPGAVFSNLHSTPLTALGLQALPQPSQLRPAPTSGLSREPLEGNENAESLESGKSLERKAPRASPCEALSLLIRLRAERADK